METREIINAVLYCSSQKSCVKCPKGGSVSSYVDCKIAKEAADRLEELEKQLDELRETNKQFAACCIDPKEGRQPEWISVEDRLPENTDAVLVLIHYGEPSVGILHYVDGLWRQDKYSSVGELFITHWMPLPEPPKPNAPTFKDVFLEKFPHGLMELIQDRNCVNYFFPQFDAGNLKCGDCAACWDMPYFEEEGEADA